MKLFAIIAMQAGITLMPPLASAQQVLATEPSTAVKSCIAANAPGVEQVFPSLNEGVDFLVKKICADVIADQLAEQNREEQAAMKTRMEAMCKAETAKPKQPASDDQVWTREAYLRQMCEVGPGPFSDLMPSEALLRVYGEVIAPKASTLAAQTLLKLRVDKLPKAK
jgi:hypothetical protein